MNIGSVCGIKEVINLRFQKLENRYTATNILLRSLTVFAYVPRDN